MSIKQTVPISSHKNNAFALKSTQNEHYDNLTSDVSRETSNNRQEKTGVILVIVLILMLLGMTGYLGYILHTQQIIDIIL